jgi:hypothetical protein
MKQVQDFYKATITQDWSIGTGNFYVSVKPTISEGWLYVSPNNASLREQIYYNGTGTDGNGDYITITERGLGETNEQTHTIGEPIRMNIGEGYIGYLTDAIDDIVAGAAPNADTSTKGLVEEATASEIDAGTQTSSTGAELFVNPKYLADSHNIPTVAPGTSTNIMTSNGTDWVSTSRETALGTPTFQQEIVLSTNLSGLTTHERFAFGSNQTGTVCYMYYADEQLTRFEKDTNSGMFIETHTINPTLSIPSTDRGSIIVIDSYIYVFSNNGTNIVCSRFSATDLTGEQVMTVPTVACISSVVAWTNGTNAYVVSSSSTTTSRTWSLSGTTFSAVTTDTITDISDTGGYSTFWDGSYAYLVGYNTSTYIRIVKLTTINATTTSTTVKKIPMLLSDGYNGGFSININSNLMYVGVVYKNYNENNADAIISYNIRLIPVTKP